MLSAPVPSGRRGKFAGDALRMLSFAGAIATRENIRETSSK